MPETPGSLAEALLALQARLPRITKDDEAQVGTRTYRYANLASINAAVVPLLCELGLLWICKPTMSDGQFMLVYRMLHIPSGEEDSGEYPLPSGTPQTMGGAITYARRYSLNAYINLAPAEDDDDGQAAERESVAWTPPANPRTRKAERLHGADPHDPWATGPEHAPGSSTGPQHQRLAAQFRALGITERTGRLALSMSVLDLPELESSKALSFSQAEKLSRELEARIKKEAAGNG